MITLNKWYLKAPVDVMQTGASMAFQEKNFSYKFLLSDHMASSLYLRTSYVVQSLWTHVVHKGFWKITYVSLIYSSIISFFTISIYHDFYISFAFVSPGLYWIMLLLCWQRSESSVMGMHEE